MRNNIYSIVFILMFMPILAYSQIIPAPVKMEFKNGGFEFNENTAIRLDDDDSNLWEIARSFKQKIEKLSGLQLNFTRNAANNIVYFKTVNVPEIGDEGYMISVNDNRIEISFNTNRGALYAINSIYQFLPAIRTNEKLFVKAVNITDYPHFAWRGMMLDVSRHFFSTDAIKDLLDMLSFYKINTFHWHLCDNEGWRLEIKKYPKLTEIGAWREEIPYARIYQKDNIPTGTSYKYGGYYTQSQVKEIIEYAQKLNITIIPEIEMPGHSGAALASYPEYSCNQKPSSTPNSLLHHSKENLRKYNLNYCAGNDAVFGFLEDILTEVISLFPSEYIHIGGDEVEKWDWKHCPKCQERIKNEHLKDENELQSYFIKRIEKFLLKHNKKLLGWDEILDGGLAKTATVMSWRGEEGGIKAAKMGHNVVMAPSNPLYFIRHQDSADIHKFHAPTYSINTTRKVYEYNPATDKLTKEQQSFILGSQFSVWTEFIPSVEHLEYMIYPRMLAFSEAVWTPVKTKNFNNFVERLNQYHFGLWNAVGIRFNKKLYKDNHY